MKLALGARWAQMRGWLGAALPDHGPLSRDAAMAGARLADVDPEDGDEPQASRLQRALTRQLETHAARALDHDLRQLPAIQALGDTVPDPRLAAWTEGCSIGRAFVAAWPAGAYSPTVTEFPEMISAYLGASSQLAARLGVGRPVRSARRTDRHVLDRWAFALELVPEPAGRCVDTWRTCHDAFTAVAYADALRAGIPGRAEPHGLFSDLLPPPLPGARRRRREGIVPDALLERPAATDEARGAGPHRTLHDCKGVHFGPTRYQQAWVLADGDTRRSHGGCVDRRAALVHREYAGHARTLDRAHHGAVADPDARPIFRRLTQEFPLVRGHVFGAFRECSRDVHALLHETAAAASAREWRECGATSADAARAAYTAVLRRRWGCTVALAGARLRLSRAYLAGGADQEATAAGDAATGFDFGDAAHMAAELAPMLGGAPAGQRGR